VAGKPSPLAQSAVALRPKANMPDTDQTPLGNFTDILNDSSLYQKTGPWVAVDLDPDSKREWVFPQPLRYYVVEDTTGTWFICDRWPDHAIPDTKARTREEAIRLFYRWCRREMPEGETVGRSARGVSHH
jgi:hypothetical protein